MKMKTRFQSRTFLGNSLEPYQNTPQKLFVSLTTGGRTIRMKIAGNGEVLSRGKRVPLRKTSKNLLTIRVCTSQRNPIKVTHLSVRNSTSLPTNSPTWARRPTSVLTVERVLLTSPASTPTRVPILERSPPYAWSVGKASVRAHTYWNISGSTREELPTSVTCLWRTLAKVRPLVLTGEILLGRYLKSLRMPACTRPLQEPVTAAQGRSCINVLSVEGASLRAPPSSVTRESTQVRSHTNVWSVGKASARALACPTTSELTPA